MRDAFKDRERAFEAEFFRRENERLIAELHDKEDHDKAAKALSYMCGVDEQRVLSELLAEGVNAATLSALLLVPLVAVAWADRQLSNEERKVIVDAANGFGIEPETPASDLLDHWLSRRPHDALLTAWSDYVLALGQLISPEDRAGFARFVLQQAEKVAEASGGVLGFGSHVSPAERSVLDRLGEAFVY